MSDYREELRSLILAEQLANSEKRREELEREVERYRNKEEYRRVMFAPCCCSVSVPRDVTEPYRVCSRCEQLLELSRKLNPPFDPAIARASNSDGID